MSKTNKSLYEKYKDRIRNQYKSMYPDYYNISNSIQVQYKFGRLTNEEFSNLCNAITGLLREDLYIDKQGNFRYTDDQIYKI